MDVERTTVQDSIEELLDTEVFPYQSSKVQRSLEILQSVVEKYSGYNAVLVRENGKIIGFAVYGMEVDPLLNGVILATYELGSLTEVPGVGTLLIEELKEIAKEQGVGVLMLHPEEGAEGFYVKMGFQPFVERPIRVVALWL